MALEEFWAEFLACLKYPMVVYKREASVERTLEFVAKFAVSVCEEGPQAQGNEDKENEEEEEEPDNPLLRKLIEFLLKVSTQQNSFQPDEFNSIKNRHNKYFFNIYLD